jgi:hypothetical protein
MLKLSICILTLPDRLSHLHNLLTLLYKQPVHLLRQCEILIVADYKHYTIGEKRNQLLGSAKGEYITFVDDDDDITEDFLSEIFIGINQGVDAIGIAGMYAPVVGNHKPFKCSKDYKWEEKPDAYYRSIQHICPIKTSIARLVKYPEINFTEDKIFSDRVQPYIKSNYVSEKIIYIYKYRANK